MKKTFSATITIAATVLSYGILAAFSSNTPNELTGAPGESTCVDIGCHENLNTGIGSMTINAPADYLPGDTLDISIDLEHSGQSRWGFEITVLDGTDKAVGTILQTDQTNTDFDMAANSRQYLKHSITGTYANTPDASPGWSFRWVAPNPGVGAVTFYAAGNAANNNGLSTGDFIYTTQKTIPENYVSAVANNFGNILPGGLELKQNFPNPFNPTTSIEYFLSKGSTVDLSIYNPLGEKVTTLVSRFQPAGNHSIKWDSKDSHGKAVASGIYFYTVKTSSSSRTKKMLLVR